MRRALAHEFASVPGLRLVMLLDDRLPYEPGPWTIIRAGPNQAERLLRQFASVSDSTLAVAPETDGLLARCASIALASGTRWLGSTPEAIAVCADKYRLSATLRNASLPVPDQWLVHPGQPWPAHAPSPAVLKPLDGAGSLDTRLLQHPQPLDHLSRSMLLESFRPGTPLSASFLIDVDGNAYLVGVSLQRFAIHANQFLYLGGKVPEGSPSWAKLALQAVRTVPGLFGWVGVDFVRSSDGLCTILEINPRPTTSLVGLRACLPPGSLALAWLSLDQPGSRTALESLSARVHAHPPVRFDADGTLSGLEAGRAS